MIKHIEVIVRQTLHKVKVETAGDADMLPGIWSTLIPLTKKTVVLLLMAENATGKRTLLVLLKPLWQRIPSCLQRPSKKQHVFLPDAAIKGKIDPLLGLKEKRNYR